jgi:hypothetical protein
LIRRICQAFIEASFPVIFVMLGGGRSDDVGEMETREN